ncbi:MAG: hypothetical protein Q7T16_04610 [Candidatus Burarchaeum sp.]|nr:hypothetical protein [Candidatus Burarchaeum sp.]MDO8339910.1 hypothetical protein [Candidatus Burarchaeum sp.]
MGDIIIPHVPKIRVARSYSNGMTYPEAFNEYGGRLASHSTLHRLIYLTDAYSSVSDPIHTFSRELLFISEDFCEGLIKGKDITDKQTLWTLPASSLAECTKNSNWDPYAPETGLFIDPMKLEQDKNRIVVVPKSIVVVPEIQININNGDFHEETCLPVKYFRPIIPGFEWWNRGWLYCPPGTIRPVIRSVVRGSGQNSMSSYPLPSVRFAVLEVLDEWITDELKKLADEARNDLKKLAEVPASITGLIDGILKY